MTEPKLELTVERTPWGNLKVELPSVPSVERQAYRRVAFKSDKDPKGIMRIIRLPPDMDTLIDRHLTAGIRAFDEFFCKKCGTQEWAEYNSMPIADQYEGYIAVYHPHDIEFQALEKLLEASTRGLL